MNYYTDEQAKNNPWTITPMSKPKITHELLHRWASQK